ncbi:MAG TPA: right-handed parallel beta-helix repeat-containing protein [Lacunisphaera sp.]
MKVPLFAFFLSLTWILGTAVVGATEYFLDPVGGNAGNAGTRGAPWGSLEAVAASEKAFAAGDVLILLAGHHGSPILRGSNPGVVTVRPDPGARATVVSLTIKDGRYWTVEGLEISPETGSGSDHKDLVKANGSDLVIRGCLIYTVRDISAWTKEDWNMRARNGVRLAGTRLLLEDNRLQNLRFAVSDSPGSSYNIVRGNLIMNFCGDGIRALGDYGLYEGNVVKNLYRVNANHPDAFQSWSQTAAGVGRGVVRGVTVRGNYFLSYENPEQPFRGALQGIGCFDGFFEDWLVENNVIITNAGHGIAFYGAHNCRIINNTVADLNPGDKAVPWIKITAHKNKTPSSGNLVRNNLTGQLFLDRGSAQADHNLKEPNARRFFPGWASGDLRLKARSLAINAGSSDGAPAIDLLGARRFSPGSAACDIGAYEFGGADPDSDPGSLPWEPRLHVPRMPETAALRLEGNENRSH